MKSIALVLLVATAAGLGNACTGPGVTSRSDSALSRPQIEAIVASPDRSDADRRNDVRRKPVEMLAFIGVRPGMTVLDVSAGGGYTTELLARAVAPGGRVKRRATNAARAPSAALAERLKKPGAANVVSLVQPFETADRRRRQPPAEPAPAASTSSR